MTFIDYVNRELALIDVKTNIKDYVVKLCKVFSNQGHSGMSASVVSNIFTKLAEDKEAIPKSLFNKEKDFYGGMTGTAVKELLETFNSFDNLTDNDKKIVLNYFHKLTSYLPLTPLTFKEDEWHKVEGDNNSYQNIRNYAVFKDRETGRPYYIHAFYMKNQKGITYSGGLKTSKGYISKCYIKDPAIMPQVCIDTLDWEVNKDDENIKEPGSGWWITKIKDESQLKELEKFYDVEYMEV